MVENQFSLMPIIKQTTTKLYFSKNNILRTSACEFNINIYVFYFQKEKMTSGIVFKYMLCCWIVFPKEHFMQLNLSLPQSFGSESPTPTQ